MAKRKSAKKKSIIKRDSVEYIAPDGSKTALQRTIVSGVKSGVMSVDVSPDRKNLVTGEDGFVRVWDLASLEEKFKFNCRSNNPCARFSTDGRTIATAADSPSTLKLWDAENGEEVAQLTIVNDASLRQIVFSPDGKLIAACGGYREWAVLEIWETENCETYRLFAGHAGTVMQVAFHPTDPILVSAGSDRSLRVWDIESAEETGRVNIGENVDVSAVAFTPDGKYLYYSGQGTPVTQCNFETLEPGAELTDGKDEVNDLAIDPKGSALCTAALNPRIVDLETGKLLAVLPEHGWSATSIALSPDGDLLAANVGGRRMLYLWDLSPLKS